MDPATESLLVSTCLALGGFEDSSENVEDTSQVYVMGDECLECLKDIKKFIKYYDDPGDNVVLAFLGKMGILEKDLIPIMLLNTPADNSTKERLVLACIELMVPMTWIIDYKALQEMASIEEDVSIVGNLHQRLETLRGYKKAFLRRGVLGAVFAVLLKPLEVEYRMRSTRDQAVIRLGLSLFRNLVAIPDTESSVRGTMDQFISSVMQEELLERFQEENIMALFVTLASSATDAQLTEWNTLTLETFFYIFMGVEPDDLIPTVSGQIKNSALQDLLQKEEMQKKSQSTAGRKRHDRFGTTGEIRLQDGSRMVLHQKGALFASFENQLDQIKKPRAKARRQKETDEYRKNITKAGSATLRNLAMTLLESCFNPLFSSLRRDIELRREKLKEHHMGQYHYLMSFLLKFQRHNADYHTRSYNEQRKVASPSQLQSLEEDYKKKMLQCDFDLVATALETRSVYQVIGHMRQEFEVGKNQNWNSIRKAMCCFIEMLSTLYAMIKSPNEEYRDASDNVQNNLYHEDATLELFLDLAKNYTKQSTKYLHTLVQMIHILLKTLENYSNSKSYMFIIKKRAVKKRKQKAKEVEKTAEPDGENEQPVDGAEPSQNQSQQQEQQEEVQEIAHEDDDEMNDIPTHTLKEHQFVFQDFERRFASERVVNTYCAFLENFEALDETQLHYSASLFHRIAVNCRNVAVFYKLSTLQLFHQILQNNREDVKRDMAPLISYLMHQFFKKLQEYPLLIVEVFFPRSRKVCLDINVGREEAARQQNERDEKQEKRLLATELRVDSNRPEPEQIKIVVMALRYDDKDNLVDWAIEILKDAVAKRQLMTFRSESELEANPELMYSVENVEDIKIIADTDAKLKSLRLEPRFRLLLKLLHFTRGGEGDELEYTIPKTIPTDTLAEYQELIESVVSQDPEQDHELNFNSLIKRINRSAKVSKQSNGIGGASRQRSEKEMATYHSAEYIIDSEDEDEEYYKADKALRERKQVDFAQAEERQRRMDEENARAKSQRHKAVLMTKSGLLKKAVGLVEDENADESEVDLLPPSSAIQLDSSDEDDDDDLAEDLERTQPKSRSDVESDSESDAGERLSRTAPAVLYASRRGPVSEGDRSDTESEDEDDQATQPLSLTQRLAATATNKRRIILEDSEEEEDSMGSDHGDQGTDDRPVKRRLAFEE
ncbi:Topoisomerase 1-associated factor 1 [Mortierella alpina]|uniref:Topoisomerase 1-associated factor 1 n=1 Tax=Mortierella alpina TaxID=64518 RepID=A0A9P6IW87_MORAP|nr:Topoisomerase 1-associated factor 1 [Mortierella alpina]